MANVNETNTETIFEDFVKKYADALALGTINHDYFYERQASKNDKIKKLLSGASKKDGSGKGRPDFIIQSRKDSNFIIAVECKGDIKYHESKIGDQYAGYAVDGVKLYSSFLAKNYDVLSIAVSGESQQTLKVSYFFQLKGEITTTPIFADKLLPLSDLYDGYIKSPEKFRQDYQTLLTFSKTLNEKLHNNKIAEDERAFLIGCILIALDDNNFVKTYASYANAKQLADYLVKTVRNAFENDKIGDKKLEVLDARFLLIKTNSALSKNLKVLKELITDINENIKDFSKTHKYFDVLGQLYIEFLRYANADKGLGIVLTPPHITEFMAEIAEVNKDSIVYDNCTGTGGFLVSAMSLMIKDAYGDQDKINSIKQNQLIGVESSNKIFPLACTNMFIHQDGKTNIYHDSCFDDDIVEDVKKKNATVGLLNPPYKSDKKSDTDEYEFILSNLEQLQQGGRCVAIVPMQEVLATAGRVWEYKKKILKLHTLEAVFSMPDELFFNSKVGVVSCIMVFTAKRPHPNDKEVYFGYYKNDGFVKRKNKGRIDLFGKFEGTAENNYKDGIKHLWITNYRNHRNVAGLSVLKNVTANDEWCAEAYMETDYSNLTIDDFLETIRDFAIIRLTIGDYDDTFTVTPAQNLSTPELKTHKWRFYKLGDLFDVKYGVNLELVHLEKTTKDDKDGIRFVSRTENNNGISAFVKRELLIPNPANTISVAGGGSVLATFLQTAEYYSGRDVYYLQPKEKLNNAVLLFITALIRREKYRFNYGRQANKSLKYLTIKLPTKDNNPDYDFMTRFVQSLPFSSQI